MHFYDGRIFSAVYSKHVNNELSFNIVIFFKATIVNTKPIVRYLKPIIANKKQNMGGAFLPEEFNSRA